MILSFKYFFLPQSTVNEVGDGSKGLLFKLWFIKKLKIILKQVKRFKLYLGLTNKNYKIYKLPHPATLSYHLRPIWRSSDGRRWGKTSINILKMRRKKKGGGVILDLWYKICMQLIKKNPFISLISITHTL